MLTNSRLRSCTPPRKLHSFTIVASICVFIIVFRYYSTHSQRNQSSQNQTAEDLASTETFNPIAESFIANPINDSNARNQFGELGRRVQVLTSWFLQAEGSSKAGSQAASRAHRNLHLLAENLTLMHFPFLRNRRDPNNTTPVTSLRNTYITGSKGIVIPVRTKTVRFAIHLIFNIRTVLETRLPIQIVYAGDDDLPSYSRDHLREVEPDIEFIDILTIFDDKSMGLNKDWAIKPFAALASTFETVILMDADTIFLQKPEVLLDDSEYKKTGAFFFHDRLIWKDQFKGRHDWWHQEMQERNPSETLSKSLVWTEGYAEEADSGVVVLNKSRFPLVMGLLHVCWQNTKAVRETVTYKMTYGDKESWWFGLELSGVRYSFEKNYAAVLGDLLVSDGKRAGAVCGFTIAHSDQHDHLIWYNGSLLKNKIVNQKEFQIPHAWIVNGKWTKGKTKSDVSCMAVGKSHLHPLTNVERDVIERSVSLAKKADEEHSLV